MKWFKASAFALVGGALVVGLSLATGLEHIWRGALFTAVMWFGIALYLDSLTSRGYRSSHDD